MTRRLAFSLVELLAALVLLAVGLAAFVRAAGAVARLENDARLRRALAVVMQARLDSIAAWPCGPTQSGQAFHAGIGERWSVVSDGRRWMVRHTIVVPSRPSLGRDYTAALACRP